MITLIVTVYCTRCDWSLEPGTAADMERYVKAAGEHCKANPGHGAGMRAVAT